MLYGAIRYEMKAATKKRAVLVVNKRNVTRKFKTYTQMGNLE